MGSVAICLLIVAMVATPVVASQAKMRTEVLAGSANGAVTIQGTGFKANAHVSLTVTIPTGTKTTWKVTANKGGALQTTYTPGGIAGTYLVSASDGKDAATMSFANPPPLISISPTHGVPGTTVSVNGTGFASNTTVTISFDASNQTQARTDATGGFVGAFVVPSTAPGQHSVSATDGRNTAIVFFTVDTSSTSTSSSSTSTTSSTTSKSTTTTTSSTSSTATSTSTKSSTSTSSSTSVGGSTVTVTGAQTTVYTAILNGTSTVTRTVTSTSTSTEPGTNTTETMPAATITATSTLSQPAKTVTVTASQSDPSASTSASQPSQESLGSPSNTTLFIIAAVGAFVIAAVSAVVAFRHRAVGQYGREANGSGAST